MQGMASALKYLNIQFTYSKIKISSLQGCTSRGASGAL